jgi:hypothetical protein
LGAGTVLMDAHDGAVDHRVFIIDIGGEMAKGSRIPNFNQRLKRGWTFVQSPKRSG